jgi:hypothetical protein
LFRESGLVERAGLVTAVEQAADDIADLRNGLSNDAVLSLYKNQDGQVWIGTNGGALDRFSDGKCQTRTSPTQHDYAKVSTLTKIVSIPNLVDQARCESTVRDTRQTGFEARATIPGVGLSLESLTRSFAHDRRPRR